MSTQRSRRSLSKFAWISGVALILATGANVAAMADDKQPPATGPVLNPRFCFDGKRLLAPSGDFGPNGDEVVLWDTQTGRELQRFRGHQDEVHAVTFGPDGKTVLTGGGGTEISKDNSVRLWDVASGEEIRRFEAHAAFVHTVRFSRDGRRILTTDGDSVSNLWDSVTGKELRKIPDVQPLFPGALLSHDGAKILGIIGGHRVALHSAETGDALLTIDRDKGLYATAVYDPSGEVILTSSSDGAARTWDAKTGKELKVFAGHTSYVHQAEFTDGGKTVVTASADGTVRLWDTATGQERKRITIPGADVWRMAVSPDGKRVLAQWRAERENFTIETGVTLSDVDTGRTILQRPANPEPELMGFSPDGKQMLEIKAGRPVGILNAATGEVIRKLSR